MGGLQKSKTCMISRARRRETHVALRVEVDYVSRLISNVASCARGQCGAGSNTRGRISNTRGPNPKHSRVNPNTRGQIKTLADGT